MQHACGVFGCIAREPWPTELDVAHLICRALLGLQHRGQESAGIVTSKGTSRDLLVHRAHGLVGQIFTDQVLQKLKGGNLGIGHTRYSTHGGTGETGIQPFVVDTIHGLLAVAHNGELVNAKLLRDKVLERGVGLSSFSDSELITQTLSVCPPDGVDDWPGRIEYFMRDAPTSYSLAIMQGEKLYAVRDPYGNRPLCIGRLNRIINHMPDGSAPPVGWVIASESCCFHSIGAELIREVLPGEIVEISRDTGPRHCKIVRRRDASPPAFCIFEYVYFSRSDTTLEGQAVYSVRLRCGEQLASESHVDADVVSTVPESATPAALGFSKKSGIPYVEVFCKNRYVGRSFIQPDTRLRQLEVARKFGPHIDNIKGMRIILVDDSIVRGNTMQPIVALLKTYGAKEIHIRIASPPLKYTCNMGIHIPDKDELIANVVELDKLTNWLGADSVQYLSLEGLKKAVSENARLVNETTQKEEKVGHCTACLTGEYPVNLQW